MPTLRSTAFVLAVSGAWLSYASGALANPNTCGADTDCDRGYRCEAVGVSDCAVAPCPEGEECPTPRGCGEIRACVAGASCDSNADCGAGMLCFEHTSTRCSASDGSSVKPCPAGAECPEPEPEPTPTCEELTEKACIPTYAAPCTTAADCGAGFRCVEQQSCGCGGNPGPDAPPPVSSGGTSAREETPVSSDDCSCEPSGVFACESLVDECEADSECPADWKCVDHGSVSSGCAEPPPSRAGDPEDRPVCDLPETVVTHDYRCTAPSYSGYGGAVRGDTGGFDENADAPSAGASPGAGSEGGCQLGRGSVVAGNISIFGILTALGVGLGRLRLRRRR
ncbi:MAG TPA: hypothetical protein VK524_14815 [Polyangiaceae bacterium]|nr:hypothetical protein [Polyangiaceae bacterium]